MSAPRPFPAILLCSAILIAGCASSCSSPRGSGAAGGDRQASPGATSPESAARPPDPAEQATAADLDRILAGDQRSAAHRARDIYRHPKQTLLFFGIRPDMRVVEIWPAGGWYTEIIAPLVEAHGKYYAALEPAAPRSLYITKRQQAFRNKLAARPDLYGGAQVTALGPMGGDIAPAGSVDMVVTFRNLHDWMAAGWAPEAFAAMYRALKPGGILGVTDHRGNPGLPQDPRARTGYVNEDYAIRLIEGTGFRLVAKSEINANPKDTKDYPLGVWTLPPTYRLGATDHDKYAAIGESDRFTLKFVKPKS
ncbi:MAG: class I SAM-dependent methyltransferase [Steroidobacteraceae bacterium]